MICADCFYILGSASKDLQSPAYRVWIVGSATPQCLCATHANMRDAAGQVGKAHRLVSQNSTGELGQHARTAAGSSR